MSTQQLYQKKRLSKMGNEQSSGTSGLPADAASGCGQAEAMSNTPRPGPSRGNGISSTQDANQDDDQHTKHVAREPISPPPRKRALNSSKEEGPRKRREGVPRSDGSFARDRDRAVRSISPNNVRNRFVREGHARRSSHDDWQENSHRPLSDLPYHASMTPQSPVSRPRRVVIAERGAVIESPLSPQDSSRSTNSLPAPRSNLDTPARKVSWNGIRDVPSGPRRQAPWVKEILSAEQLAAARAASRFPHIFISDIHLPLDSKIPPHLIGFLKQYRPDDIIMGEEGWLLVYPDTEFGRDRLMACYRNKHRQLLFRTYTLHMACFENGWTSPAHSGASSGQSIFGSPRTSSLHENTAQSHGTNHCGEGAGGSLSPKPRAFDEANSPDLPSPNLQTTIQDSDGPLRAPAHVSSMIAPPLNRSSMARLSGRPDRDDASSSVSGATPSDIFRAKRTGCHVCKQEAAAGVSNLVCCSTCPRRYHRRCHTNPAISFDASEHHDWQCSRCVKKGKPHKGPLPDKTGKALPDKFLEPHEPGPREAIDSHMLEDIDSTDQPPAPTAAIVPTETAPGNPTPVDPALVDPSPVDTAAANTAPTSEPVLQSKLPSEQASAISTSTREKTQAGPTHPSSEIDADDLVQQSFASDAPKTNAEERPIKPGKLKFTRKKADKNLPPAVESSNNPAATGSPAVTERPAHHFEPRLPSTSVETIPSAPRSIPTAADLRTLAAESRKSSSTPASEKEKPSTEPPSQWETQGQQADSDGVGRQRPSTSAVTSAKPAAALATGSRRHPQGNDLPSGVGKPDAANMTPPVSAASPRNDEPPQQESRDPRLKLKKLSTVQKEAGSPTDGSVASPSPANSPAQVSPVDRTKPKPGPRKGPTGLGFIPCGKCRTRKIMRDPSGANTICTYCKTYNLAKPQHYPGPTAKGDNDKSALNGNDSGKVKSAAKDKSGFDKKSAISDKNTGKDTGDSSTSSLPWLSVSTSRSTVVPKEVGSPGPAPKAAHNTDKLSREELQRTAAYPTDKNAQYRHALLHGQLQEKPCDYCRQIGRECTNLRTHGNVPKACDACRIWHKKCSHLAVESAAANFDPAVGHKPSLNTNEAPEDPVRTGGKSPSAVRARHFQASADCSESNEEELGGVALVNVSPPGEMSPEKLERLRDELGDSFDRPKGSRAKIVGMALCAAVDNRLQQSALMDWIAANIPTYKHGEGNWVSRMGSMLTQGKTGGGRSGGKWRMIPEQPGAVGTSRFAWWELLPGMADIMWQWDEVLKEPSPPSCHNLTNTRASFTSNPDSASHTDSTAASPTTTTARKPVRKTVASFGGAVGSGRLGEQRRESDSQPELPIDDAMDVDQPTVPFPTSEREAQRQASPPRKAHSGIAKASEPVKESSDEEPIGRKHRKTVQIQAPLAPTAMMQPTPSVTETDDQSDSTHLRQHGPKVNEEVTPGTLEPGADISGIHNPSAHVRQVVPKLHTLELRARENDGLSLGELVRLEALNVDYSAASLFEEWPEYAPQSDFSKAAKAKEIRKPLTRKQMFGKPASRSCIHPSAPSTRSLESPVKRTTMSPEKRSRTMVDARPTDPYPWEDPNRDYTREKFATLDEFFGLPDNPLPILSEGQLAFRDGTRTDDGRLPRAKAVFKTGYAA